MSRVSTKAAYMHPVTDAAVTPSSSFHYWIQLFKIVSRTAVSEAGVRGHRLARLSSMEVCRPSAISCEACLSLLHPWLFPPVHLCNLNTKPRYFKLPSAKRLRLGRRKECKHSIIHSCLS